MISDLETKRLKYKQLRSSLDKKSRDKWRQREFFYMNSKPCSLTPDEWLFELNQWVLHSQFQKAYNAWQNNRKSNPYFWGEYFDPFLDIEKYKLTTSKAQKTFLLKQQLTSDILLEENFQNSQDYRD